MFTTFFQLSAASLRHTVTSAARLRSFIWRPHPFTDLVVMAASPCRAGAELAQVSAHISSLPRP
jgi:hypothetical protein